MLPCLFLLLCSCTLLAQDFSRLPRWAVEPARAAMALPPPASAEAWVVLQRTELAYAGGGELRKRLCRLVRVLGPQGVAEASLVLPSFGGTSSRIQQLRGWNLRPDGEVVKLEKDDVIATEGGGQDEGYVTRRNTQGTLSRVVPGSWVAFEALETLKAPMGPVDALNIMEEMPIHRWEVRLANEGGWFSTPKNVQLRLDGTHLSAWPLKVTRGPDALVLQDIPALKNREPWAPPAFNTLPRIHVGFVDPSYTAAPSLAAWDDQARWFHQQYAGRVLPIEPIPLKGQSLKAGLQALASWMARELTYKQVYLTADRGWTPASSSEVARKRYGDCKDLAACFMGGARTLGLEVAPVLARIGDGRIPANYPVTPYAFNHVIAALKLRESLGFAAEVATPAGRYLLVDLTSRITPVGMLPSSHRGGRVMICTEQGSHWVAIPDQALEKEGLTLHLKGRVDGEGDLKATLEVEERGNCAGLQSGCLLVGASELKVALVTLLHLPPDAMLEVRKHGKPLDASVPFKLEASITLPRALRGAQGELMLSPLGLPGLPKAVPQVPLRQLPLASQSAYTWDCVLDLEFPFGVTPLFAERRMESPFRVAT